MTTSSVSPVTTELAGSETGITLVIHAGAGSRGKHSTPERIAQVELDLQRALDAGYQLLESGAPAHEAVVAAIHVMEDAPEFNAGRGAALTSDGIAQMDACLMTGDGEVGAVTGVSTVKNPIDAARAVKEHGTIGAVARDAEGNIAAGTSTGGITNQMHGRVGDSPLPGCGTFANQSTVAVSCTGIGEAFIKVVAAHQVSDRVRFSGENVEDAATATLDEVAAHHGDGGMIVLPAVGRGVVAYNSEMMNFGYRVVRGHVRVIELHVLHVLCRHGGETFDREYWGNTQLHRSSSSNETMFHWYEPATYGIRVWPATQ